MIIVVNRRYGTHTHVRDGVCNANDDVQSLAHLPKSFQKHSHVRQALLRFLHDLTNQIDELKFLFRQVKLCQVYRSLTGPATAQWTVRDITSSTCSLKDGYIITASVREALKTHRRPRAQASSTNHPPLPQRFQFQRRGGLYGALLL